jgi:hypothetical protein
LHFLGTSPLASNSPQAAARLKVMGQVMASIVGISFCCVLVGGLMGFASEFSSAGFALAALAAIIFFSAIDAWECENSQSETAGSSPPGEATGSE